MGGLLSFSGLPNLGALELRFAVRAQDDIGQLVRLEDPPSKWSMLGDGVSQMPIGISGREQQNLMALGNDLRDCRSNVCVVGDDDGHLTV